MHYKSEILNYILCNTIFVIDPDSSEVYILAIQRRHKFAWVEYAIVCMLCMYFDSQLVCKDLKFPQSQHPL